MLECQVEYQVKNLITANNLIFKGTEGDLDETKINETVETLNTLNTRLVGVYRSNHLL